MARACTFSSTRWCSFSMYMTPTVTSCSNGSPVRPSWSLNLPEVGISASVSRPSISFSGAPSKAGQAQRTSSLAAAMPRCVSRICPTFMRDGTPSGFRTMSTGVPSSRYGMSSSGADLADHTLVAVAAGHLVADGEVPLGGDVDLDHLEHAVGSSSPRLRRLTILFFSASLLSILLWNSWICWRALSRFDLVSHSSAAAQASGLHALARRTWTCRPARRAS